jgi:hypothetical protein
MSRKFTFPYEMGELEKEILRQQMKVKLKIAKPYGKIIAITIAFNLAIATYSGYIQSSIFGTSFWIPFAESLKFTLLIEVIFALGILLTIQLLKLL